MSAKKIACVTLDIEPDFADPQRRTRFFEDERLMNLYIQMIQANQTPVTGFLVTSLLERYAPALDRLAAAIPLEYELHSHDHHLHNPCSREQIETSLRTFEAHWGTTPRGYRTPWGLIDQAGVNHLLDYGFQYDSSVYPAASFYPIRPGKSGYWNFHFPTGPFQVRRDQESLIEIPFAALRRIRLIFSLSYVKLLGMRSYRLLMKLFPLPDVVILLAHPYDYYVPLIADKIPGWEKYGLLRNGWQAFDLFDQMIKLLKEQGYQFMAMSELIQTVSRQPDLPQISIEEWR